jgi:hypothetical protein
MNDKVKIILFDGTNFEEWEMALMSHLKSKLLAKVLFEDRPLSGPETQKTWDEKDEQCQGKLIERILFKYHESIRNMKTSKEIFEKIKSIHQGNMINSMIMNRRKFNQMKCHEGNDVKLHLLQLEGCKRRLEMTEAKIGECELIMRVIDSLPESWKPFLDSLRAVPEMQTDYEKFSQAINNEASFRASQSQNQGEPKEIREAMNATSRVKSKFKGACHNCGILGHKKMDCWKPGGGSERKGFSKQAHKARSEKHYSLMAISSKNREKMDKSNQDEANIDLKDNEVQAIVDSGASDHMFCDAKYFTEFTHNEKEPIHLAGGGIIYSRGKGTVKLRFDTKLIELTNVLHVPELSSRKNLISVPALTRKGVEVKFTKNKMIGTIGHDTLFECNVIDGLYKIYGYIDTKQANSAHASKSLEEWHRTFGHLNYEDLKKLPDMINDMKINESPKPKDCEICMKSKGCRQSFKQKEMDSTKPGEMLVIDIGFVNQIPYLAMTDVGSNCTKTVILNSKSDSAKHIMNYIVFLERQFGHKVKVIRNDGALEFKTKVLNDFYDQKGIKVEITVAYTPEQNGIAERKNRSIKEMARACLIDSKLSQEYAPDAILYATLIRNRCPTKAKQGTISVSPIELLTGVKPSAKHMQPFGTRCYSIKSKNERMGRGTLEPKGIECIILLMTDLGYFVEEVESKKRYVTCHVRIVKQQERSQKLKIFDDDTTSEEEGETSDPPCETYQEQEIETQVEVDALTDAPERLNFPPPVKHTSKYTYEDSTMKARNDINLDVNSENIIGDQNTRTLRKKTANLAEAIPSNFKDATELSNERDLWMKAIDEEFDALKRMGTFGKPVELPAGAKALHSGWVFVKKTHTDGSLDKYKARLVAKGYRQVKGIDYDEVFAPVASITAIRLTMSIAVHLNMKLSTIDVSSAYLYATLDKEIYLNPPEGWNGAKGKVLPLLKGLYGLKQSGRLWYHELKQFMESQGLMQNRFEPALYSKRNDNQFLIACTYVDDILIAYSHEDELSNFLNNMERAFKIKTGNASELLNISINHDENGLEIGQENYILSKVRLFELSESKTVTTPMETGYTSEGSPPAIGVPYLELIGSLGYAAKTTRPDISQAYGLLARKAQNPSVSDWHAARRVLKYLHSTRNMKLFYSNRDKGDLKLKAYSDANFNRQTMENATSGNCILLGNHLIYWKSKMQKVSGDSAAIAEINAAADCIKDVIWISGMLEDLGFLDSQPIVIHEDNQACIKLTNDFIINQKTRHCAAKLGFIRSQITNKKVKLEYIATTENIADLFTKALDKKLFTRHRDNLCLRTGGVLESSWQEGRMN